MKDYSHRHSNHDHPVPTSFGTAFALGAALNVGFVAIEAGFGFFSNSTALLADAGHNLSDVFGLSVAWAASVMARRAPTMRFTYGWRSSSILAALFNAMFLLVAIGAIAWEAAWRFCQPETVGGLTVMIVAAIGILINGITAMLFASGRKRDINIQSAFLHMAADAAVSAGVVIAGLIIILTGWTVIDPLVSVIICVVIFWSTWKLLQESVRMSLDAVPSEIDGRQISNFLMSQSGVSEVHDLHIWPISTTETALTCHAVIPDGHPGDAFLMEIALELERQFAIAHTTIQIEIDPNNTCPLRPEDTV